jgi:hypothetical protein
MLALAFALLNLRRVAGFLWERRRLVGKVVQFSRRGRRRSQETTPAMIMLAFLFSAKVLFLFRPTNLPRIG